MSVIGTDNSPDRSPGTVECHTARFTTQWTTDNVGIIAVGGELDASNATAFADHVAQCATDGDPLVLDLSGLEFFGTAGFSALHTINVRCADTTSRWVLVIGDAVARLLRVCDPDGTLPVADSVPAAVKRLDDEPRRLLKLVPEPS